MIGCGWVGGCLRAGVSGWVVWVGRRVMRDMRGMCDMCDMWSACCVCVCVCVERQSYHLLLLLCHSILPM